MNGQEHREGRARSTALRGLRGNPLVREVDRLEALTLGGLVLVGLLLLPVMLVLGSLTHASVAASAEAQSRTRHEVVATLTEDAPEAMADSHGVSASGKSFVPATWTRPDGSTANGVIQAPDGLDSGAEVDVWLDEEGRVTLEPARPADAVFAAVIVGAGGWLVLLGLLALVQLGVHRALDSRRYRAWDAEWARVEPGWNNYRR